MADEKALEGAGGGAPRVVAAIFVAAIAVCCLVPFVGMTWAMTTTTTENRELAEVPQLVVDGEANLAYLSDWGDWFEDHFAYRNELISLNAELYAAVFGVSSTDTVVVGTDGWLYYAGTLSDYCGWNDLSDRAIDNIAFNLSLMQGYVQAFGAEFIVTFAPNKNTLYDENMPYYYTASTEESNLDRLLAALEEAGVNYVDMEAVFEEQDEVLYYLRDTHWNTKGALLACQTLLSELGLSTLAAPLYDLEAETVEDYVGDINSMLYPTTATPEVDYSYDASLTWEMVQGESVEDSAVVATGEGAGTLLMYRDSFANNMIQFLASVFATSYYTKLVPYDLTLVGSTAADVVIIERAERNLADLGTDPAIMPAPSVSISGVELLEEAAALGVSIEEDGTYLVVTGDLPEEYWDEDASIYIGVEAADGTVTWYVPFHITTDESDWGYKAYFRASTLEDAVAVWVACSSDGAIVCVDGISIVSAQ